MAMPAPRSRPTARAPGSRLSSSARPKRPRSTSPRPRPTARASTSPTARSTNAARWSARARRKGVVRLSTLKEPYRLEGKKTMGFELAEQLGWELPDVIFYPTGGGTGLIGMWKAFDELEALGLIGPKRPRMCRGPGRRLRADRARVRARRRVRRALGECGDRRDGHARAYGGRRFPDPARGARQRRRGDCGVRGRDPAGRRRRRARRRLLLCPEGGAVLARGVGRSTAAWSAATRRVLLFNCANGNKYPLADRSQRLKLAEAERRRLSRHCEEPKATRQSGNAGLLRCARNDGRARRGP